MKTLGDILNWAGLRFVSKRLGYTTTRPVPLADIERVVETACRSTVSVVVYQGGLITSVRSFFDDLKGNCEAQIAFIDYIEACCPGMSKERLEGFVDAGTWGSGGGAYEVWLVHSLGH